MSKHLTIVGKHGTRDHIVPAEIKDDPGITLIGVTVTVDKHGNKAMQHSILRDPVTDGLVTSIESYHAQDVWNDFIKKVRDAYTAAMLECSKCGHYRGQHRDDFCEYLATVQIHVVDDDKNPVLDDEGNEVTETREVRQSCPCDRHNFLAVPQLGPDTSNSDVGIDESEE